MALTHLKSIPHTVYPYRVMEKYPTHLRAVIFDCDGVLVDSEPLHFQSFNKVLAAYGAPLSEEDYKSEYLSLDDKGAFSLYFKKLGSDLDPERLNELMAKKTSIFQELIVSEGLLPYPAVPEFVMAVSQRYPSAVASGARKHELDMILESAGIRPYFEAVISADDVMRGKPDPESFLKALDAMNRVGNRPMPIRPEECLVIEDSISGIASAHNAGMKCIAVATSYPAFELKGADLIVPSMSALHVSKLEDLFSSPPPPLPAVSTSN
jgi:beta-phosphoglucomutase